MKDKEKQIEEMSDIIFNSRYKNDYISPLKGANELYNVGYRKLPENSVVLSREEYQDLKARANKKIDGLELKIGGVGGWFPISFIQAAIERVLDHDRITLSREEYESLIKPNKLDLQEQASYIRKETAEKIFDILYQWLNLEEIEKYGFVSIQKFDFLRKFREIYKQFSVEIKE